MKALYTCDLHGRKNLYEEMMAMVVSSGAEIILLGGDLFPTLIPNPLALINGRAEFQDDLKCQFRFLEDYLIPLFRSFQSCRPGIRIMYTPGNHDWIPVVKRFEAMLPEAENIHSRVVTMNGIDVFGYACVTDSTFWVKDYARRDRKGDPYVPSKFAIVSDSDRLVSSPDGNYAMDEKSMEEELADIPVHDPGRTICIFHCPPHDTGLDTLHNGKPIGSRSIRALLEKEQPLLSLHGHIHEAPYMSGMYQTRIGKTIAANPGHGPNSLHALVFDTDDPLSTMTHSVFGQHVAPEGLRENMPERRMRKVKAFFMDRVLKGT